LIIEIDGNIHLNSDKKEYDISRNITLNDFGIQIIRFNDDQVIKETDIVIEEIKKVIISLKQKQVSGSLKVANEV
jgi:very-short-patch-repair endonuclease